MALGAQGFSAAQGFMQAEFLHAAWSGQSSLYVQPIEIGSTSVGGTREKDRCDHSIFKTLI